MNLNTTNLFSAAKDEHLYPIFATDYFNRTKVTAYNLSSMSSVIRDNFKQNNNNSDLNILDWGCGNSLWAYALFPEASITGVDIAEKNLNYSKMNAKINASKFRPILFDRDLYKLKENTYDCCISIALIEFLNQEMFNFIFSKIYSLLKPGAKLFVTHHNYRPFSATYLPWIHRGGYAALIKRMGQEIQIKSTIKIIEDFKSIGYDCMDSGGFNPYPTKFFPFVFTSKGYLTRNSLIQSWYYSQFIVLQKPI